ncbi:MAG: GTPase ObgE [Pseudomonadota bacterium]
MRFLDRAKIHVKAGDGGDGAASFRREKYIEFGGPDGGHGGNGGDIIARCNPGLNTLIDFRYRQHFVAPSGKAGRGANRTGIGGVDLYLDVPCGTQILLDDEHTILADLTEPGEVARLAIGGRGGRGNSAFKSSTNRTPRTFESGERGERRWIWLQLKLLADLALIGLPNAGKSTLLAHCSRARPKIADYPFTTTTPMVAMVQGEEEAYRVADIPGLIADAHCGRGLGHYFLRHVERCNLLLHLVDFSAADPETNWRQVRYELAAYSPELAAKPEQIILSKCDLVEQDQRAHKQTAFEQAVGAKAICITISEPETIGQAMSLAFQSLTRANNSGRNTNPPPVYDPLQSERPMPR